MAITKLTATKVATLTATGSVAVGDYIDTGGLRGIALEAASASQTYEVAVGGKIMLTVASGKSFTEGARVYVNGGEATTDNIPPLVGYAGPTNGSVVEINLLPHALPASVGTPTNLKIISQKSDFPAPVGGLITLESDKVYHIDGTIDLGSDSLVIPTGGCSISSDNGARDVSVLTSSENNYTMFKSPSGSYSGNVVMSDITITVSGTSSKVFDLDNDGNSNALDIMAVNFVSCTSLGDLTDYRQLLLDNIGFISVSDGITFNGTWSGGIAALTSIAILFPAGATLFKEGTSLVFNGSFRSDMNFLSVDATSVFCDFQPSNITNDAQFSLTNFRTTATNALPNFPSSSVKARIRDCVGVRDTYVGGEWTITSSATTSISAANTLVKLAGTTTYADMQWFSNSTDNAFVYDSDQEIEVNVKGSLGFTGGLNDQMGLQIRQWDDSASSYKEVGPRYTATLNGGGGSRVENLAFFGVATLNENDRIEIWIENQTDTSDITGDTGGIVDISERTS